jgi:excisionase family DNA binding protein
MLYPLSGAGVQLGKAVDEALIARSRQSVRTPGARRLRAPGLFIPNPFRLCSAGSLVKESIVSTAHHNPHRRLPQPPAQRQAVDAHEDAVPPSTGTGRQLLYTPSEAAAQLRVRESWLRRKAAARQIPGTFLGKHLRFSAADLAGIVAQHGQAPTGRRPRRRGSRSTVRDRDLPARPMRSVDPPDRHDHNHDQGSSTWHG